MSNKLKSISIENIKGINAKAFEVDLWPNKPSIFVAPNGFGKSSIACAFKSLNNNRIDLKERDAHKGDTSLEPKVKVSLDADVYEATNSSNTISSKFDVFVINSPVYAKGVTKNMGRFSTTTASLEVEPVVLIDTIPAKEVFNYSLATLKQGFGVNGKILLNAKDLLGNKEFIYQLSKEIDKTEFNKARTYTNPLKAVIDSINAQSGTAEYIKQWVEGNLLEDLQGILPLQKLAQLIAKFTDSSEVDNYLFAYQIACISQTANFKKAVDYQIYLKDKLFFDEILSSMNSTRHEIKTKEVKSGQKKRLEVAFPKADEVSNGQRDILSFVAQIQRAKRKLSKQHCILVVDEIFDYLDDANLVAFQYYVTLLIEEFKQQDRFIYPLLLTHLDPNHFRHFCFNKHKIQTRYLAKDGSISPSKFLQIIKNRNNPTIKVDVEKYHLHYHPDEKNLEDEFHALTLKKAWGKSHELYNLAEQEKQKYLNDQGYDPIAVLLAVRIQIEKNVYEKLTSDQQTKFINEHGTKKKLNYCSIECGVNIPEIYYLLGIVYNDPLHWDDKRDYETPLYSKLNNPAIKNMIRSLSIESITLEETAVVEELNINETPVIQIGAA